MRFNKILVALLAVASLHITACSDKNAEGNQEDNIIGESVKNMSELSNADSATGNNIVIFDETVRRIHQFDLDQMTYTRSFEVKFPTEKHFVLYQNSGNYIVDMTTKNLSIINKYGQVNDTPIRLQGNPRSAAFRQDLGLLVIYDDLMSVGMLKLDGTGEISKSWIGGPSIFGTQTIAAGDITDAGKLILALSDRSIAIVDLEQSMAQKQWVYTRFTTTGLDEILWVAPVRGTPGQVLLKTKSALNLLDLNSQAVISTYAITDVVHKSSKRKDAHILLRDGETLKIAYVKNSQIETRVLFRQNTSVLTSVLDLANDVWTFADTNQLTRSIFNDLNEVKSSRLVKRYRFSDMLAMSSMKVPDQSQIQLADKFAFALFPSELGYAVRYNIESEGSRELKLFNVGYIQ